MSKKKTALVIGGVAAAGILIYLLTRPKSVAAPVVINNPVPQSSPNLLNAGTSLLSSLTGSNSNNSLTSLLGNLFKGGGSSGNPAASSAGDPTGFDLSGSGSSNSLDYFLNDGTQNSLA